MTELVFVMGARQNHFFVELVEALRDELAALGMWSRITTDGFPPPRRGEVCALVPPHEYFALEGFRLRADPRLLRRTVQICAEQPGSHFFDIDVRLAGSAGAVFDIHRWAVREMAQRGISAHHLQLGWTRSFKAASPAPDRPVDALFMGAMSRRRLRHLAFYADHLSDLRCELRLSDNSHPNDSRSPGFVTGEPKWNLLSRARTLLNLHVDERPYFEWLRVVQAIVNGCVVISEHSAGFEPLVPGEHFISGRPETLALLALEVIHDDALRARLASSAEELLRSELPLRDAAALLAEKIEQVDRSVPPGRHPVPRKARGGSPEFVEPRFVLGRAAHRRAFKDARIAAVGLRRKARQLASRSRTIRLERRSHGYASTEPRVSVIVALYNHAREVPMTLESVRRSNYRSIEVVVVDDGSHDDSAQVVLDWIAANESIACTLLRQPFNRGLPHARNAALGSARGEYAFILDADNELYRHGLEKLVSALDQSPKSAFAYGLLQKFDESGPVGVLNARPWEPERLRAQNYIDAMALLRRRTVLELGGYTTDLRLFGWEDYDLWCKLADAGDTGVLVREFVGRYRVSPRSMITLTNTSTVRAFATLGKRHPRLMGGQAR